MGWSERCAHEREGLFGVQDELGIEPQHSVAELRERSIPARVRRMPPLVIAPATSTMKRAVGAL